MSSPHRVALHMPHRSPRAEKARIALASCLPGATVTEADETGTFEVEIEADDQEAALSLVWNAMGACGGDDQLIFAEHPDIPGHWRPRPNSPTG
jgi:hypothetical protein